MSFVFHTSMGIVFAVKIPTDKQLLKQLRQVNARALESDCVLSSSVATLKCPDTVPASWKRGLERQAKGLEPDWRRIWGGFLDLVPSIENFLKTMCLGIRIFECPARAPSLIYLYAYEMEGKITFAFMSGAAPVRKTQLTSAGRERFNLLPDELQTFYRKIHDGYLDVSFCTEGILRVEGGESLHFLSDLLNEDEWAGPGRKPFRLKDILMIYSEGGR